MKLVIRVTALIFLLLTISTSAIGYFAISKYKSSQINQVDDSLNSKIKALVSTKEDPLTVAQYLAQVSAIPVTVQFITEANRVTDLTVSGPPVDSLPSTTLMTQARHSEMNFGKDLRIRVFQMPSNQKLLVAESLTAINSDVSTLTRDLIIFIVLTDGIAVLIAFIVFRRDGKLNQLSRLVAQQKNAMQKFLGDASHELRTPLTVIKGYVDLARRSDDATKVQGYLEKSSNEIFRMESIIKDLLFLAEVGESREPAHNPVNLDLIIKGHIEVIQALNPERSVEYLSREDSVMYSDQALMDRMIGNLFSNIRRHTPKDAPVRVALDRSNDSLILVVEDGGPGFENFPDKTRLSKRFSPERSADGTGLGLSIISSIVDRYEGNLSYSRSSLGGVRVEITLPLSRPESSG
jgi:two-component system, OmpR family, sensor kinase